MGGISSELRPEIYFYGDAQVEPLNVISKRVSDDIPPLMKVLNMVIPILMPFCSFMSNCSVASRENPHVIIHI